MPRLPVSDDDEGIWGTLLNEYLTVAHNSDGTIKDAAVTGITGIQVVLHGATPSFTRPSEVEVVIWKGSVQPTNFEDGDIYIELV